jgi:hypothetical protein
VDTLLIGRKTAKNLIPFWDNVATDPGHKDYDLGKRISELNKVVFSKSISDAPWKNTEMLNGNLKDEITK